MRSCGWFVFVTKTLAWAERKYQNIQKKHTNPVDFFQIVSIMINCMDTHNERTMAFTQIQTEIGSRKMAVGAKQMRKALSSGKVFRVYLAQNADPAITEPLMALCKETGADFAWVRSMNDLGRACGIEVGAAAAAALK